MSQARPSPVRSAGVWVLLAVVLAAAPSCRSGASDDGKPSVVASFYPLEEAARQVGGSAIAVTDLTPAGAEPHDLELTPEDVEAVATADLVLYLGSGFQPAIEDAIDEAEGRTVDILGVVDTLPPPAGAEEDLPLDPHVWLDPVRYEAIVQAVADALAAAVPGSASTLRANAADFVARLQALDADFEDGLSDCARRTIVTSHAAFGYLADRYDLEQIAISGLSPDVEPDAARLAELTDLVEREGVTTIFTETLVSPKVAETLAREAGVSVATLDPLEGLTDEAVAAGEDYGSVMRANLETLRSALGCS